MALENCHLYFLKPQEFEEGKEFYATGVKRVPGETGKRFCWHTIRRRTSFAWRYPQVGGRRLMGRHHDDRGRPGIFRERCGGFRGGGCADRSIAVAFQHRATDARFAHELCGKRGQYVAIAAGSDVFSFGLE